MWARERNGRVAEVTVTDPAGRYHPDLVWVGVPQELRPWVKAGWPIVDGAVEPPGPAALRADMLTALAERRWRIEVGGVTLPTGATVRTDRESQALINGAAQLAAREPDQTVSFKAQTGWVDLTAAEVEAIAVAVAQHVRQCFRREKEIAALLDGAATVGELLTVWAAEIDAGWPAVI